MMMVGLMRGIDPPARRGIRKLNEAREKINPIKEQITDEDLKR
jgi:hypothetical protein